MQISFEEFRKLNENDLADLLYQYFNKSQFDEIEEIENLIKIVNKDYLENNEILYYLLLGLIGNKKLNRAKGLIEESNLLSNNKDYFEEDSASFTNLLSNDYSLQKVVIIALFLIRCTLFTNDYSELEINYYELISSLYELGYSKKVIDELNNDGFKIFKIGEEK